MEELTLLTAILTSVGASAGLAVTRQWLRTRLGSQTVEIQADAVEHTERPPGSHEVVVDLDGVSRHQRRDLEEASRRPPSTAAERASEPPWWAATAYTLVVGVVVLGAGIALLVTASSEEADQRTAGAAAIGAAVGFLLRDIAGLTRR